MEQKASSPIVRHGKIGSWAKNTAIALAVVAVMAFGSRAIAPEPSMASQPSGGKNKSGEVQKTQDVKKTVAEYRKKGIVDDSTPSGICIQTVAERLGMNPQEALGALYGNPKSREVMEKFVAGFMLDNGIKDARRLAVRRVITVSGERIDAAVSEVRVALGTQGGTGVHGAGVSFSMPAGADSCVDSLQVPVGVGNGSAQVIANAVDSVRKAQVPESPAQGDGMGAQNGTAHPEGQAHGRSSGGGMGGNSGMLLFIGAVGALWAWLERRELKSAWTMIGLKLTSTRDRDDGFVIGGGINLPAGAGAQSRFEEENPTATGRFFKMGINFVRNYVAHMHDVETDSEGNAREKVSVYIRPSQILEHVDFVGDAKLSFLLSRLFRNAYEAGRETYYGIAYALQGRANGLEGAAELGKEIDGLVEDRFMSMNGTVANLQQGLLEAEKLVLKELVAARLDELERAPHPSPDGSGAPKSDANVAESNGVNGTLVPVEAVVNGNGAENGLLRDRFDIRSIKDAGREREFEEIIRAAAELRGIAKLGEKKQVYEMVKEDVLAKFGMKISDATILRYARKHGQKAGVVEFEPRAPEEMPLAA